MALVAIDMPRSTTRLTLGKQRVTALFLLRACISCRHRKAGAALFSSFSIECRAQ
jgi:hypothetical protein